MAWATLEQVARILDLTPSMVNRYVKFSGMPRVNHGAYDLVACVHWYLRHLEAEMARAVRGEETVHDARRRLTIAHANLREIELKEMASTLIERDLIAELMIAIAKTWKEYFLEETGEWARGARAQKDSAEMKGYLEGVVHEALRNLPETQGEIMQVMLERDRRRRRGDGQHDERKGQDDSDGDGVSGRV